MCFPFFPLLLFNFSSFFSPQNSSPSPLAIPPLGVKGEKVGGTEGEGEGEGEGAALSDEDLTKIVGRTEGESLKVQSSVLPCTLCPQFFPQFPPLFPPQRVSPPPGLVPPLRPYQEEALWWMAQREEGNLLEASSTLHPCWEARKLNDGYFSLRPLPFHILYGSVRYCTDIIAVIGVQKFSVEFGAFLGEFEGMLMGIPFSSHLIWGKVLNILSVLLWYRKDTPLYHNVFSGEASLKFPSALQKARGGVSFLWH